MAVEKKTRFTLACLLVGLWRLLLSRMGGPGASVMAFGRNRAKLSAEEFERLAGCINRVGAVTGVGAATARP